LLVFALFSACGAKSGIRIPEFDAEDAAVNVPIDAFIAPDSGPWPPADICVELPPMEPPRSVEVSFVTRIVSAEVHFLIDVTASMGEEIEQIRARLGDTIIPGIGAQIPDVRFSVSRYADFPVTPYGSAGGGGVVRDDVYQLEQASTSDTSEVQQALERLSLQSGGDIAEATVEALYISATGDGGTSLVPARDCPLGTLGYPCFSRDGSRIFLLFTDAPMHNGPDDAEPYDRGLLRYRNVDYEEAIVALRMIGAKVLGLYSGLPGDTGMQHLERVARDTGAVLPDGRPIVFDIGVVGASLGPDVVSAVQDLVQEVPIDIDALIEDWPLDEVIANDFVTGIVAERAEPPSGATRLADRFAAVRPGTRVTFSIMLANERFELEDEPQVYRLIIVLRGDGVTRLTETVVDIVIPARDGRGCDELE
jgi:hypothetical protein